MIFINIQNNAAYLSSPGRLFTRFESETGALTVASPANSAAVDQRHCLSAGGQTFAMLVSARRLAHAATRRHRPAGL
jgi:hypothetical protein